MINEQFGDKVARQATMNTPREVTPKILSRQQQKRESYLYDQTEVYKMINRNAKLTNQIIKLNKTLE